MKVIIGGTPESQFLQVGKVLEKAGLTFREFTSLQDFEEDPGDDVLISMGDVFDADVMESLAARFNDASLLLLYSRPEYVLQYALPRKEDLEERINHWEKTADAVLKTFKKHRSMTTLMHGPSVLSHSKEFADLCRDRLGVSWSEDPIFDESSRLPELSSPLPGTIAAQWVSASPELRELNGQLEACAVPLGEAPPEFFSSSKESAKEYRVLAEQLLELELAKTSLEHLQQERHQLKDAEEENEMLLLQLHQVQEELESYYLEAKSLKDQLAEKQQEIEKSLQEKNTLLNSLNTAEALSAKQKELSAEQKKLNSSSAEAAKAAESSKLLQKQLQTQLEDIKKQLADVKHEETHSSSRMQELEEENELLLQQLHQVQEELESYYLEVKSLKDQLAEKQQEIEKSLQEKNTLLNSLNTAEISCC